MSIRFHPLKLKQQGKNSVLISISILVTVMITSQQNKGIFYGEILCSSFRYCDNFAGLGTRLNRSIDAK